MEGAGLLSCAGDHPRVRGEQADLYVSLPGRTGSPPRARGAEQHIRLVRGHPRITPACAGSSPGSCRVPPGPTGSPPRVRGAGRPDRLAHPPRRITPACAGSRRRSRLSSRAYGDHPRVRGEQVGKGNRTRTVKGSPPRARGADAVLPGHIVNVRITPACAGSRRWPPTTPPASPDHPRVRGEQLLNTYGEQPDYGSPPRARGAVGVCHE